MNRIASRALALLLLVFLLAGGVLFFLGEYMVGAKDWIVFSGSPHVYHEGKISTGVITDREGFLLANLQGQRGYSPNSAIREATLHWVGDRQGNIYLPMLEHYTHEMLGYDLVNGAYAYGDNCGNMELTISARVQMVALEAIGDLAGTVGVYNYETGEILCAVSSPTYDPENVPDIQADDTGKYQGVYVNRFLQSRYIPGSIFKIVTLAAALETMPQLQDQRYTCEGVYRFGNDDVTCEFVHGEQSLKEVFSNSCNCGFAEITQKLGADTLERYVELLSVTKSVSFDGITTAQGNFDIQGASAEQVAWSGIGQHKDQVNPCAFMAFMGAVAADGVGIQPYVVNRITVGDRTTYTASAHENERVLSISTAQLLQEYMRNNVEVKYGLENFPNVVVCAKTGTGEVGGDKKPNAMLAGFVQDERYPLAFIVALEEGGYGSKACIPVIDSVLEACMEVMDGM